MTGIGEIGPVWTQIGVVDGNSAMENGSLSTWSTKINSLHGYKFWRGCGRVLKSLPFHRQHHLNNFCVCIPFLLRYGTSVNVERRPAACVPQQFLGYLDIDA
jgi:hypothetical protein